MDGVNKILEGHILSLVVVVLVVVGGVKSILDGNPSYEQLVQTLGPLVGLTAVGRGIAAYKK